MTGIARISIIAPTRSPLSLPRCRHAVDTPWGLPHGPAMNAQTSPNQLETIVNAAWEARDGVNAATPGGPGGAPWWDKIPAKAQGWDAARFREAGYRAVPGSVVRRSAFVA